MLQEQRKTGQACWVQLVQHCCSARMIECVRNPFIYTDFTLNKQIDGLD